MMGTGYMQGLGWKCVVTLDQSQPATTSSPPGTA